MSENGSHEANVFLRIGKEGAVQSDIMASSFIDYSLDFGDCKRSPQNSFLFLVYIK